MKKALFFITILCLNASFLNAQTKENLTTTITGTIIDSLSGKVVDYPTVALFSDSLKLIKAVAGGADGKFYLTSPSKGKYILSVSMIGYTTVKKEIQIPEGSPKQFNIGTIYLIEGVQMSAVTVIGVKPLIKNEADKLTYNFESDPQTTTSTLVEIIKKIPMLSVDGDGSVRLNGETNFKVLVNGRSTGILVKNFKEDIKAMPATSVKSVEVITNPSTKYDAEGVGGIINIITNRNTTGGYSGSLSSGINTLGGYNFGGYISAQRGKLAISADVDQNISISNKNTSKIETENYISNDYRFSNSISNYDSRNNFKTFSMDISHDIDSLNLLTFSGWGYLGSSNSDGISDYKSYNTQNILSRSYRNITDVNNEYGSMAGSLSYQKTFKKPDQNLTISYNIDAGPSNTDSYNKIEQFLNYFDYHQHSDNEAREVDHTFQLDYYNPVSKKHNIETGAKYILRQSISDTKITLLNYETGNWIDDPSKVHDLDYNQHIISLYGGYNYKFKAIMFKAGLRMEYNLCNGEFTYQRFYYSGW
jgi:outer membrane receptor for ferrienterochelin and colicin